MLKLGYLGPEGSFSHEAAELWSQGQGQYDLVALRPISGVLDALRQREIARAIVPIENSLGGEVGETVDCLIAYSREGNHLEITGESLLPIKHVLVGKAGLKIEQVRRVISHPQALAQCRDFLRRRDFEVLEATSTAQAAETVSLSKDSDCAAIASSKVLERYDLEVIARDIGDNHNNITRFVFLGGPAPAPTGNDKTTVFFITEDEPGALYQALGVFYYQEVNLSKISSRTTKGQFGEYIFWLDAEGHQRDPVLQIAIPQLKTRFSRELWVAGSYPRARIL